MSAPSKEGLDYFTLDCQFEDSVELVIAEFGLKGLGLLIRLWQKIYGFGGYYCQWNEDVALMFAHKNNVGVNVVSEIIDACLRRGVFDRGMYERCEILTSKGIQKRYFEATKRRQNQNIKSEYLLFNTTKKEINVNNNSINVDINPQNVSNNRQSKVNESKVNESKVNKEKPTPSLEEIIAFAAEERLTLNCEKFYNYYKAIGWKINGTVISDWKAKAKQWSAEDKSQQSDPSFNLDEFENYINTKELKYRKVNDEL